MANLDKRIWWEWLDPDLKELLLESDTLARKVSSWNETFHDYAFVVFPAAKAYEGFLKNLFLDLQFITEDDYYGKHFRIGRALNPSLERNLREKESVYDRVVNYCNGEELAHELWNTWKTCRNILFHWFPREKNAVGFDEAKEKYRLILDTMDLAFKECKIDRTQN